MAKPDSTPPLPPAALAANHRLPGCHDSFHLLIVVVRRV